MKNSDKIKRAIAFYSFVMLFFILLPVILAYSLGYHIDFKELKIYKRGIIYITSHPTGAFIYINGKLHTDLTPAQIEELKPGTYRMEVRREGFYPWEKEVVVKPNMVTKAEHIILFPIVQETKRIGEEETIDFAVLNKSNIYYMARSGLFRSNIDGSSFKKLSSYSNWPKKIVNKKFSTDGNKFLYFDERNIWVVYLNLDKTIVQNGENAHVEEVLISEDPIVDVFWHSLSNYIIIITEKYVDVLELQGGGKRNTATLYKFNKKPKGLYYDEGSDSLYFTDAKRSADSKEATYLYRLDLRQTFFSKLMQLFTKKEVETLDEKR